jgi:hypothetical protein
MTQSLICANSIFRRTTAPEFPHLNVRCPLPLIGCPRVTLRITRRPTRTEAAEITVKRATPVLRPLSSSDVSIARIVHQLFPFYGSVRSSFFDGQLSAARWGIRIPQNGVLCEINSRPARPHNQHSGYGLFLRCGSVWLDVLDEQKRVIWRIECDITEDAGTVAEIKAKLLMLAEQYNGPQIGR